MLNPYSRSYADRPSSSFGRAPEDVLRAAVGREVVVETRVGKSYRGVLTGFDRHMNLVLQRVTETRAGGTASTHPEISIRGDGLLFVKVG